MPSHMGGQRILHQLPDRLPLLFSDQACGINQTRGKPDLQAPTLLLPELVTMFLDLGGRSHKAPWSVILGF